MMSFTPSDEEIKSLAKQAKGYVVDLQRAFDVRLGEWLPAYQQVALAYNEAYKTYNAALRISQKRKAMMIEVSIVALAVIAGRGFEIIQSSLMQDSLQFNDDCKKLFGDVFEWGRDKLASTLGGKISQPKTYKAPELMIKTDPTCFLLTLENILSSHKSEVDVALQELIDRLNDVSEDYVADDYTVAADTKKRLINLISQHGNIGTIGEAQNLFRWIFWTELKSDLLGASSYFANSPNLPSKDELKARFERCMWAETFRVSDIVPPKWLPQDVGSGPIDYGLEFIRQVLYKPGSPVEKRLVELGIMAPSGTLQKAAQQQYPLDNFGNYTDDRELEQLKNWAVTFTPEYIGGPMDPSRRITSPQVWRNFKLRAYAR